MVQCNKSQGNPCICDLDDPFVKNMIQRLTVISLKIMLRVDTFGDADELRTIMLHPHCTTWLQFYIEKNT